ncbi:MAG: 50S ribosomal protein L15 [Gammaproteobacteria bacterium]|nr:50S ribosomal protein L15 [Gammaproteobacteria bacterium]
MQLNDLSPAPGSIKAKKRVGRGIGSGSGKTCGTGHKGQKSRSGGTIKPGFEGGQMPLQMRLPKYGFSSRAGRVTAEVRTSELNKVDGDIITIESLRKAGLISVGIKRVKVMLSGEVTRKVTLEGIRVTKGAKAAIEKAGGKVIEATTAEEKPAAAKKSAAAKKAAKAEATAPATKQAETPKAAAPEDDADPAKQDDE